MQRTVPFFNYPFVYNQYKQDIDASIDKVLQRGAFILQQELIDFEKAIEKYVNIKHAIGVANGTESMFIALLAAGIKPGDEVILASHTYIATAASVHFSGGVPVLVECGKDHLIDPQSIKKAITSKTKFIMPTQLNGRVADMDAIQSIADENNLIIIEDAAQALGAKYKDKYAGTFGLAGSISLYPAKVLGAFGDGGLLFTNDDDMYYKMKCMRDHGRNDDGMVMMWGVNSRLDNLNAAVLLVKLKYFQKDIERRREIASIYDKRLKDNEHLLLPPAPDSDKNHYDIYQNYEIEADRRDELRIFLKERGIGSIIQWGGTPVHKFKNLGLPEKALPFTEKMFERCFLLPMNTSLINDDVHYICDTVIDFYKK
ncbi:MAG: DegT/DnrJ/EryC1/StrS family aminotransferase [Spirochaetes bacterium]|nr:DegT/DnrJ/EryC1/StrS family aminotransferase [Spirochaetota bacterium]